MGLLEGSMKLTWRQKHRFPLARTYGPGPGRDVTVLAHILRRWRSVIGACCTTTNTTALPQAEYPGPQ